MDFLKKNWAKIITVAIALTGAVLVLIPVFMTSKIELYSACQNIGIILFFVGLAATACLKMSEKTKEYAKYVGLSASILVLIFMSIGLGGFCKDKDKAQGALGNAYAIYKSVPGDIKTGQDSIDTLTQAKTGLAGLIAAGQGTVTLGQLKLGAAGNEQQKALAAMAESLVSRGLVEDENTVSEAEAAVKAAISIASSQLPADIKATKQDAEAGALTVLFIYVSMIFAFGLIPAVRVTKKLVTKDK